MNFINVNIIHALARYDRYDRYARVVWMPHNTPAALYWLRLLLVNVERQD